MIKRKKGTVKKDPNKTKAGVGIYRDIPYESSEELAFLQWGFELLDNGYIDKIERSESFLLSEPLENKYNEEIQLKTKVKKTLKTEGILRKHIYTPEFKITWNDKATNIFTSETGQKIGNRFLDFYLTKTSYIECKSKFDFNNMTRLFVINQKWMWEKHKIYIQLVIPIELFENTFFPKAFLTTEKGNPKKITGKVKMLEDFIK